MRRDYWLPGKNVGSFWVQLFPSELLARALAVQGFRLGPTVEAYGDTSIDEAEGRLLAKLQQRFGWE